MNTEYTTINKLVLYKPTKSKFTVKKIRKNGSIELENGGCISKNEFDLNWIFID